MTTIQDLVNDINTLLVRVGTDRISGLDIRTTMLKVVDLLGQAQTQDIIPDWSSGLTFQTDGTDDGRYCSHPDTNGQSRIWKTKNDNNTGNEPPTDPLITSDSNWEEKSPSISSGINEWSAGIFGDGLVIVFWNHSTDGNNFYKLIDPARPFESINIETEITAGKWEQITSASGGGLTKPITASYATIAALLADQGVLPQATGEWYYVTDASTDTTVTSGWAIYEYLGTTNGDLTDYRKIMEQESIDIVINDATSSVKGIMKLFADLAASNTDGAPSQAAVKAAIDAINNRFNVGGMGLSM